ncbi:YIP1 family protein [Methanoplanus endosymbiosus]|uniref:YIP1 family protein n=1 Tax=Methanoplanus endosymbiosus TaxID=33865 RepID=A0A9E7PNI7_9EURY|nr:Yip1 family protein [Methanoplanus endosymbiosus]UUX92156.1 YIP1 family protein [Methanoplanus endosymbiosus]
MDYKDYGRREETLIQATGALNSRLYQVSVTNMRIAFVPQDSTGISPFSYYPDNILGYKLYEDPYGHPGVELEILFSNGISDIVHISFMEKKERDEIFYAVKATLEGMPEKFVEVMHNAQKMAEKKESKKAATGKYSDETYGNARPEDIDSKYRHDTGVSFPEKIKGFLLHPADTFYRASTDSFSDAFIFALVMLGLSAVINIIVLIFIGGSIAPDGSVYAALKSMPAGDNLLLIIEFFVLMLILLLIYGLLVFVFSKILGTDLLADESYVTTFYSATPFGTVGLIPVFGLLIAPIWMIFLQFTGYSEGHGCDSAKSAVCAIIPAVIMALVIYYIIFSGEVAFI